MRQVGALNLGLELALNPIVEPIQKKRVGNRNSISF